MRFRRLLRTLPQFEASGIGLPHLVGVDGVAFANSVPVLVLKPFNGREDESFVIVPRQSFRDAIENGIDQPAIVFTVLLLLFLLALPHLLTLSLRSLLLGTIIRLPMDFAIGIGADVDHFATLAGSFDDNRRRCL